MACQGFLRANVHTKLWEFILDFDINDSEIEDYVRVDLESHGNRQV